MYTWTDIPNCMCPVLCVGRFSYRNVIYSVWHRKRAEEVLEIFTATLMFLQFEQKFNLCRWLSVIINLSWYLISNLRVKSISGNNFPVFWKATGHWSVKFYGHDEMWSLNSAKIPRLRLRSFKARLGPEGADLIEPVVFSGFSFYLFFPSVMSLWSTSAFSHKRFSIVRPGLNRQYFFKTSVYTSDAFSRLFIFFIFIFYCQPFIMMYKQYYNNW